MHLCGTVSCDQRSEGWLLCHAEYHGTRTVRAASQQAGGSVGTVGVAQFHKSIPSFCPTEGMCLPAVVPNTVTGLIPRGEVIRAAFVKGCTVFVSFPQGSDLPEEDPEQR